MERYFDRDTVDHVFVRITGMFPHDIAVDFDGACHTYSQLREDALVIALKLRSLGVRPHERVAILLPNCYEYIALYFGIFLAGATAVPINTRVTEKEVRNILMDASPKVLFARAVINNSDFARLLGDVVNDVVDLTTCVMDRPPAGQRFMADDDFYERPANLAQQWTRFVLPATRAEDVALVAYTSGTTSHPKGVMITHGGLVNSSFAGMTAWGLTYDMVGKDFISMSVAPLYGAQGFLSVLLYLIGGLRMRYLGTFNPNAVIRAISREPVALIHTQPTMWSLLLSCSLFDFCDFSRLRYTVVSGSVCSHNLATRIEERTGSRLINAYGLIEGTGLAVTTRPDDPTEWRRGSVGRPIPGVELRIVDADRRDVPPGAAGEVALRGNLMRGYLNQPDKTAEVLGADGFLYTGDLGRLVDDQNLQIIGRVREMIIRGGFNVFPSDVEEELLAMDGVQDVAVVGKPHDILGQSIVAFIVPAPGADLSAGDVLRFARGVLSSNKLPDTIHFLREMPIITNGKVRKNDLERWAVEGVPANLRCHQLAVTH